MESFLFGGPMTLNRTLGFVILLIAVLRAGSAEAATKVWSGSGDGVSWSDASNWVNQSPPVNGDDVVIPTVSGNPTIEVTSAVGTLQINSLNSSEPLEINGASLTVGGPGTTSTLSGGLTGTSGYLGITGTAAAFNASGPVSMAYLTLFVNGGATGSFPGLVGYTQPQNAAVQWTCSDDGSQLNFPNLATITGSVLTAAFANGVFTVTAENSGAVSFPALTSITVPAGTNNGEYTAYGIALVAQSSGTLTAGVLTTFSDNTANPGSSLTAETSGVLSFAELTAPVGLQMNLNDLSTPQQFTSMVGTNYFQLNAGTVAMQVADINSFTTILVNQNNAQLSFPQVASYTQPPNAQVQWTAGAAGCGLSFPGLTTITGSIITVPFANAVMSITADGGAVSLPSLTSITVPVGTNNGEYTAYGITLAAHDSGTLTAGVLTTFNDNTANPESALIADSSGVLSLADLTATVGVSMNLNDLSNPQQFTSITGASYFQLNAGTVAMEVGSVNGIASITVAGTNIALSFPNVASYTQPANVAVTWTANGGGCQLSFPGLTTITGAVGTAAFTNGVFSIVAENSGAVNLPALTAINVPAGTNNGEYSSFGVQLIAHDSGVLKAGVLASFSDDTTNPGSALSAYNSGELSIPDLTAPAGVAVDLDELSTPQQFTSLAGLTSFEINAGIVVMQVADISSLTNITATGTAQLSFPNVTTYTQPANTAVSWTANGDGASLSFPGLTTITGSLVTAGDVNAIFGITAENSGAVNLPALTAITVPAGTNDTYFSTGGVGLFAHSSGVLSADLLSTFVDNATNPLSSLIGDTSGQLVLPQLTAPVGLVISLNDLSNPQQLTSLAGTTYLEINAGTVAMAVSSVSGRILVEGPDTNVTFPNVTDLSDVTQILVEGDSSTLTFANVTAYTMPANTAVSWTAGASDQSNDGCALSLPALTTINGSGSASQYFDILALNGAEVNLVAVKQVVVPGTPPFEQVQMTSENTGSLINLSGIITTTATWEAGLLLDPVNGGMIQINASGTYPNLNVTNLAVAPASLTSSAAVTVTWNDDNTGNGLVNGPFSDSLVVTNTTTAQTLLTFLIPFDPTASGSSPITAGQSIPRMCSFKLPDGSAAVGNLQFTVTTDYYNQIFEDTTTRTNNTASMTVAATLADYPDFAVTSIVAPATALLGQSVPVSWTMTNQGSGTETGPWKDQVFACTDASGSNPQLLASFTFAGPLAPNASVTRTEQVTLPASAPGNYYLSVTTNASPGFYELNAANNTLVDSQPVSIGTYAVSVTSSATDAAAGTPITLSGTTYNSTTNALVGNAPVLISVTHAGTVRQISVVSNSSGQFQAVFQPLPGEAGDYSVAAGLPSASGTPAQSEFSLFGMALTPAQLKQQITPGVMFNGQATLQNLGTDPLSGIQAAVTGVAANLKVQVTPPTSLGGSASATVNYSLVAMDDSVPASPGVQITLKSAQGAMAVLALDVQIVTPAPQLVAAPPSLTAGVMPGAQALVSLTLTNAGGAPTGPLTVGLPPVSWISLGSSVSLESIPAGGSASLTVLLTPPAKLAPGPYTGSIAIAGPAASLSIPVQFNVVSQLTGSLVVQAVDELTYYAAGSPKIAGAAVTLTNPTTGAAAATGVTDATGSITFANLPAGYYNISAQAAGHGAYSSNVLVTAGQTNDLTAFLTDQLITYTWVVTPTTVQDQYTFNLIVTFSTDVPIPEVTVEPASLDLSTLTQATTQVNFTITNHGLIAAQTVALQFGGTPMWQLTPLAGNIGVLPAESSVVVPVTVTNLALSPALTKATQSIPGGVQVSHATSPGGPCSIPGGVNWSYPCGGQNHNYSTPIIIYNANGDCGPLGGGVGGGGGGGGGSGSLSAPIGVMQAGPCSTPPPQVEIQVNDTPASTDDKYVRLKCDPAILAGNTIALQNHPTGRFYVNCQARVITPGTGTSVTLVNPDQRLRFPEESDATVSLSLPSDGSWVPFQISGELVSESLGDAIIQAQQGGMGGNVIGTAAATVFDFNPAEMAVVPGGAYSLSTNQDGTSYFGPPAGQKGVYLMATGTIAPSGVNCGAPQLASLQIGIVQNALTDTTTIVYSNPTAVFNPGFNAVTVAASFTKTSTLTQACLDSAAAVMPLYDRPGTPVTLNPQSLQPPGGCAGGSAAMSSDTPDLRSFSPTLTTHGTAATETYRLQSVSVIDHFRTWAVTFDLSTNEVIPISEAEWAVTANSNPPSSGSAAFPLGPPFMPTDAPLLNPPFANTPSSSQSMTQASEQSVELRQTP